MKYWFSNKGLQRSQKEIGIEQVQDAKKMLKFTGSVWT
jgi:hypothetical protein